MPVSVTLVAAMVLLISVLGIMVVSLRVLLDRQYGNSIGATKTVFWLALAACVSHVVLGDYIWGVIWGSVAFWLIARIWRVQSASQTLPVKGSGLDDGGSENR